MKNAYERPSITIDVNNDVILGSNVIDFDFETPEDLFWGDFD